MMRPLLMLPVILFLAACGTGEAGEVERPDGEASFTVSSDMPTILVYKTATCGCCNGWVEHLREAGFTVDARDVRDLMTVKRDAGVPVAMSSCHTAIVDGYVVEGHVPAEHVAHMLEERPEIVGIAVPGMPIGSPGMEGGTPEPYQVLTIGRDGSSEVFADVDPR
ncbi:MAG: DUF411 domain-containing protein [Gemmatimonadota bacterium]